MSDIRNYYAIETASGFLGEDGGWEEKPTLARYFDTEEEAKAAAEEFDDARVITVVMRGDESKGGAAAMVALLVIVVVFPWDLKWATLVMMGGAIVTRMVMPGKGSEVAFLLLLGYAIFGSLGVQCGWLVLPFVLICYIADKMRCDRQHAMDFARAKVEAEQSGG